MAKAVTDMAKDLHSVAHFGEIRVSTKTERRREDMRLEAELEAERERSAEHSEESADRNE